MPGEEKQELSLLKAKPELCLRSIVMWKETLSLRSLLLEPKIFNMVSKLASRSGVLSWCDFTTKLHPFWNSASLWRGHMMAA